VLLDSSTAKDATIRFVVELAGSRATNTNTRLMINSVAASADASDASIKIGSVTLENGEQTVNLTLSVMTSRKTKTIKLKVAEGGGATPTVPVEAITLDKDSLTLTAGTSETLTASVGPDNATDKTVTWTTSDEAVAKVENGVVTAVAAGTATITAKAGEKTATCVVTVSAAEEPDTPPTEPVPVETIALSNASLELGVGKSETLTASVGPENATDKTVTWSSDNATVATVDQTGKVTAVAKGIATITAKAGEITASCKVTVIENLPALSALKFSAGSAATSVEYALEPAFDPAVREYTVIVPDNSTQFWAWATLGEGLTNNPKIIIKYFNTSGKETTKNITSGAAKGVSIGSFLKTGHDVKELSVLIADETAYTVKVVRKSQLKGINLSSDGSEVPLTPAFSNTTTEYSATVAYDKELTLGATATFSTSTFTVNGQPVDAVNKAATVSFIPQWDENMSYFHRIFRARYGVTPRAYRVNK
jgi:uncharacterized protein YjdB